MPNFSKIGDGRQKNAEMECPLSEPNSCAKAKLCLFFIYPAQEIVDARLKFLIQLVLIKFGLIP